MSTTTQQDTATAEHTRGMPYAYADGFGTWHAVLPAGTPEPAKVAQRMIRDELDARGALGKGYRVRVKPEPARDYTRSALRYVEA